LPPAVFTIAGNSPVTSLRIFGANRQFQQWR
jgi:hypothetical protein